MRRVELSIFTSSWKRNFGYFDLFEVVEWARVLQNLTLTQHQFVDLWEVRFRPGKRPSDLIGAFGIESASQAAARGARDLIVVRAPFHGFLKHLYFEYGVSFAPPLDFRRDAIRVTLVGTEAAMRRALSYLRRSRIEFDTVTAGAYPGRGQDPLSLLSDKQRKVLELAFSRGYFEIPARTTARALAASIGISHQALLDTLHRAERRLLSSLLSPEPSSAVSK